MRHDGHDGTARTGTRARGATTRALGATTALLSALLLGACGAGEEPGTGEAQGEMAAEGTGALLDPNQASESALRAVEALPDTAVTVVLEGRPFADVVALDEALSAHMDSTARTELYRRVWIPIDLNEASDEAILLIPGVGDRLLHEFKEYRPYRAMEQFRREIGKYVDDEEVARLERYVVIGDGAAAQ